MKERGIIMTGESVLGILTGRKTVTRRVVKDQALIASGGNVLGSRFGDVGDRLWVREALIDDPDMGWVYEADKAHIELDTSHPTYAAGLVWMHHAEKERCHSRHMPKWAARIWLEVLAVRIERLHDLTEADAIAEGIQKDALGQWWCGATHKVKGTPKALPAATEAYASKWDEIDGEPSGSTVSASASSQKSRLRRHSRRFEKREIHHEQPPVRSSPREPQ